MAQALVCEAGRCQELEAFDLTKVRPLAEGEEVKQFGDVVASVPTR